MQSFNYNFSICCAKKRISIANEQRREVFIKRSPYRQTEPSFFSSILASIQTHSLHSFAGGPLSQEKWWNRNVEPAQKSEIHFFH